MHRLQQHILHQLIHNTTCRYADLKPAEVEGNLFMYHMRCLMKEGWVEKNAAGRYQLTSAGKTYVDQLSLKTFSQRIQPRIVTLTAVQNDKGEWLMYRRQRQPLINLVGFPYGKIHLGETILSAATRELKEKTGLSADLTHVGDGYATTFENSKPISQIMFHFFKGQNPQGRLKPVHSSGETLWLAETEFDRDDIMPNVKDLLALISGYKGERFFAELQHHLE